MEKSIKKIALVLVLTLTICASVLGVSAAQQKIQLGGARQLNPYIAGVKFSTKETTSGEQLYCLNIHKYTAKNTAATLVRERDRGLAEIIRNGYPYKSITGDKDKDYYITQSAVWWYLDETTGSTNLGEQFKTNGSDAYGLRSKVKELVNLGLKYKNQQQPTTSLTIGTNSNSMTLQGNYYQSSKIKATSISNMGSYKVSLENAPEGTEIVVYDESGNVKSTSATATVGAKESFIVRIPSGKVTKTEINIKVIAKGSGVIYRAYEYQPTDSKMQNVALLEKEIIPKESAINLELSTTKITVVKIDSVTKKAIAGAKLVLKDANGKQITSWTSTINGHVIRNLSYGTYTIEEVEAPNGYRLNKNVTKFTLNEQTREIKINIENAPKKVVVNITKIDKSTNSPLAGAVLVVKDSTGKEIARFTTTEEPYVLTDLEDGTYTVEEISAPAGYIKSSQIISFTVDDNNLSHQITFENYPEVIVPDTSSSSIIFSIIGIAIISLGIGFVYKNGKKA